MKFIVEMTYDKRYPSNISHSKSGCGVGGGGYPTIRMTKNVFGTQSYKKGLLY